MRSGRGVGAGAGGVSPRRPAPREEESWRSGAASSRPDAAGGPCGRLRNPRWTSVLRRRAGTGWRRLLNRPWPWRRQAQAPGPARDGPPARGVRGRGALRAAGERHGLQEGAAQGAGPGPGPQPGGPGSSTRCSSSPSPHPSSSSSGSSAGHAPPDALEVGGPRPRRRLQRAHDVGRRPGREPPARRAPRPRPAPRRLPRLPPRRPLHGAQKYKKRKKTIVDNQGSWNH